jgi:serine protease AprX
VSRASRGGPGAPARSERVIASIASRLGAHDGYAGRGVTIAFLDSGFYAHDDLIKPRDRILAYHDLAAPRRGRRALREPDVSSWHGMMTSVVAAGSGACSGDSRPATRYRGLAHEAELVLVKVGSAARIVHDDIRRGLEWVIARRARHRTRIINVSCGGDYQASYLHDGLSLAAEAATRAGIVVVAAVGNSGRSTKPVVFPPASAPSVIAVGGIDDGGAGAATRSAYDGGDGGGGEVTGYHSSYGPTIDGLQKPDLVAPAIWIPAPILPDTPTAAQATLLAELSAAKDAELAGIIRARRGIDRELEAVGRRDAYLVRELVAAKLRDQNVLSGHYKHVDGTSFAAPIVSSVVAQMLEANPRLTPAEVRRILVTTARPVPGIARDRQGYGVVQARAAVEAALAS